MSIERHNKYEINITKLELERSPSSPIELAREIMGDTNVFSPEDGEHYWGIELSPSDRKTLETIPFSEQELRECKDTHILVAILPLSFLDMKQKIEEKEKEKETGQKILSKQGWYHYELFTKEKGTAHWALIRKIEIPNSTLKTYDQQLALLTENEDVPDARDLIYALLTHFIGTGEQLFPRRYVRTKTLCLGSRRVYVGYFDVSGLQVSYGSDGDVLGVLGLGSVRKSSGKKLETPIRQQEPVPMPRKF